MTLLAIATASGGRIVGNQTMTTNANKRTTEELPFDTVDTPINNSPPQPEAVGDSNEIAATDPDEPVQDTMASDKDAPDSKPLDAEEKSASAEPEAAPAFVPIIENDASDTADADEVGSGDANEVGGGDADEAEDHNYTGEFQDAAFGAGRNPAACPRSPRAGTGTSAAFRR